MTTVFGDPRLPYWGGGPSHQPLLPLSRVGSGGSCLHLVPRPVSHVHPHTQQVPTSYPRPVPQTCCYSSPVTPALSGVRSSYLSDAAGSAPPPSTLQGSARAHADKTHGCQPNAGFYRQIKKPREKRWLGCDQRLQRNCGWGADVLIPARPGLPQTQPPDLSPLTQTIGQGALVGGRGT